MYIDKNDPNRNFFLKLYKDIVQVDNEYCLQNPYEEDDDGNVRKTTEHDANPNKNALSKSCDRCVHNYNRNCLIRTSLEKLPEHNYIPCHWNANCDAYSPIYPLNIIKSENEMINFIENAKNFFGCPENYESYFGFERRWNEETGDVLESVKEYYNRGGKFENIPDKYPSVIYFGVVDFDCERITDDKLNWIYIG